MKQFQLDTNKQVQLLTGAIKTMIRDLEIRKLHKEQLDDHTAPDLSDTKRAYNTIIDSLTSAKEMLVQIEIL